jgi:hypothetical protein
MNYADNKKVLKTFYEQNGLVSKFDNDSIYLENAFNSINKIWQDNLDQIETVNYLMIAEAPLWGQVKKYIYNPDINNSQFFYRSDLGDILNKFIADKRDFIKVCNEIGLLVVDISPFPLNTKDTSISYRDLTTNQYRQLVSLTIPTYFEEKIKAVMGKKSADIKTFFRYARVQNTFQDLISKVLIDNKFIKHINDIGEVSQNGGGIDKTKLGQIIKTNIKQPPLG